MAHVHYIGHATVLIDIGHIRVLTDPILRDRLLFLQRHGPNPAPDMLEGRPPDLVILSHLHYDHTDLPSLRGLQHTTPLIVPRGSGKYLRRNTRLEICEVAAGDKVQLADVEITALPAEHGRAMQVPRPMTTCLSYALCNHQSVYFAGDTDLFEGMTDIGAQYNLDVALLPVWGFGPWLGAGHLTPLTAARALTMLRPRVAVPIHWGALRYAGPHALWQTVDCMHTPPHAFAEHAASLAPRTEVRVIQPGHSTAIGPANNALLS